MSWETLKQVAMTLQIWMEKRLLQIFFALRGYVQQPCKELELMASTRSSKYSG
jgi:hypothetical protein